VDKKQLLRSNLARIMVGILPQIHDLTRIYPSAPASLKQDGTPVTPLDLALSVLLERMSQAHFPDVTFYSEENFSEWNFPLIAIDPLDGTREYIRQRPEWAISIGLFESQNFSGEGWVYNPLTKEVFNCEMKPVDYVSKSKYYGEVSHSEWERGLYNFFNSEKFAIKPKGSIAYKLGLLAAGNSDFVISMTPKSIWDIAGGTLLCQRSKIKFYSEGKEVLEVKQNYLPPLIWCHEEIFEELSSLL
jgi:myo-inositol-1(or 4)-monophosphatase